MIGDKENAQDAREAVEAMQKECLALNLRWSRRKHNLTADQKLYEKMTASIRNVKTSYVTVNYVEGQEISLKTKREQLNQQGNTGSEENNRAKRQVEKGTKTVIVFDRGDALMDKATTGRACSRTAEQKAIAETASKPNR